LIFWNKISVSV